MNSYNKNDLAQLAAQTHFLRDNLEKVLRLTESEIAFIDAFNAKSYQPELLFDNDSVLTNIRNHPMAQWKMR